MTGPASPASGTPGEFGLDLDLAAEAVKDLARVRDELNVLRAKTHELHRQASTDRSAHDLVSLEAFDLLAQKADGGPGSLGAALDAGIVHVQGLIDQMNADIEQQRRLEEASRLAFRSP